MLWFIDPPSRDVTNTSATTAKHLSEDIIAGAKIDKSEGRWGQVRQE